jgi:hypothetical protein
VGDNITIGMPSNGVEFTNIAEHLKGFKKLGKIAGDINEVGAQVVSTGYDAGSAGAIETKEIIAVGNTSLINRKK